MIRLIIGKRGKGKTTLAYCLACRKGARTIYDPRWQFQTSTPYEALLLEDHDRLETIVQPEYSAALEFSEFCDVLKIWIRDLTPGQPRAIVIDEARFVKPEIAGGASLDWILRCSDYHAIDVIFTCHRPTDVPVDVRAIADVWCVFQTTQEHDLKILRERCGEEFAAGVQRLTDHQFLAWDDSAGELTPYMDPRAWHVPIAGELAGGRRLELRAA